MKVTSRYEIPKETYEHTNGDVWGHVGDMIVRELCKKIADIVANGEEYIFRMTPNDIMENPYTNSMQYQRYVLYEPLIRCKDCRWWQDDYMGTWCCRLSGVRGTNADDFCSWGERKGGDTE